MEAQRSIVIVAGTEYDLSKVVAAAKSSHSDQVLTAEFTPFEDVQVAQITNALSATIYAGGYGSDGEVTLFKREGRWIIITGSVAVRKAVDEGQVHIKARILSAQSLKRCRLEAFRHPDEGKGVAYTPPPPIAPAAPYEDKFKNSPRFSTPRPAYNKPNDLQSQARKVVAGGGIPKGQAAVFTGGAAPKQDDVKQRRSPYGRSPRNNTTR